MTDSNTHKDSPFVAEIIRQQFPLIAASPNVYLDNAATTQKPQVVISAIEDYYRSYNSNVHRASHQLSEQATVRYEAARETVKAFINASSSREIIWTSGTTESINLVAQCYAASRLQPGDEILVSVMEHHSNIVPWQQAAERTGAILHPIPLTQTGDLDIEAYQRLLSPRTRMVAITQLSNALGTLTPLKHCIDLAHEVGAQVLVDGAQAIAHLPVDVQSLDCDFYAFSGHKIYGPTGIGVLYGKEELLKSLPPWKCGGEMIETVSFSGTRFNKLPFKFEAGTPNIAGAIGLAAALRFLSGLDRQAVMRHEQHLLAYACDCLSALPGLSVIASPMDRAALIPFVIEGFHTYDIGALLDQQGIAIRTGHHCAMPLMEFMQLSEGTARASFALYNTNTDVQRLVEAIEYLITTNPSIQSSITAELSIKASGNLPAPEPAPTPLQQNSIQSTLENCRDWQSRYTFIMKLGKHHNEMLDNDKTEANQLHGCTSKVWLCHNYDPAADSFWFKMDSNAKVIRGLGTVLIEAVNGLSAEQIIQFDIDDYFRKLGLIQHLSPSRTNGIKSIMEAIREVATDHQK
ncbi:MAG: SufS family cysteine desulfurase [Motiliproteus sp.]